MGLFDWFRRRTFTDGVNTVHVNEVNYDDVKVSPELRAVLDLRADAIASLTFRFKKDLQQKGTLADVVGNSYSFVFDLMSRLDAGETVAYVLRDGALEDVSGRVQAVDATTVTLTRDDGTHVKVARSRLLVCHLPNARAKLNSLKHVLAEQQYSREYRALMWKRSGQVGNYITRPAGVEWSDEAYKRFAASWHDFQRRGARAGETPVLEDGMKIERFALSAHEEEWEASQRLALQTICNVYNVPLQVFIDTNTATALTGARAYLYSDTLGGLLKNLEDSFTALAVLLFGAGASCVIDIEEKTAGSFIERAGQLVEAVGAPILMRNEARRYLNLAGVDGGDELVTPLNLLVGGQVTPGGTPTTEHDNARALIEAMTEEERTQITIGENGDAA